MARASVKKLTTKPKTTKPRVSRTVSKSFDLKAYGPEPVDITSWNFVNVLNWYNYMHEPDETRAWLFDFLKKEGYTKQDIAAVRRYPKTDITRTFCTLARIMYNGNSLPESTKNNFDARLKEILAAGYKVKEVAEVSSTTKPELTIQDRIRAKNQQLIAACEEVIDTQDSLDIYEWLTAQEAGPAGAAAIRDFYARWIPDFEYELANAERPTKKAATARLTYWKRFVEDCDRYIGNKKVVKVRKPRERKTKSAVDLIKKLSYQKEFPPLKIVSVNPTDIIGAQQLWTYNTKYKKLTRFDASGPNGIQVKGATLTGFDVETSLTKSLRKPEEVIHKLLGAGKVALRKLLDEIKTNPSKPTGRINTDTVLLRVIK